MERSGLGHTFWPGFVIHLLSNLTLIPIPHLCLSFTLCKMGRLDTLISRPVQHHILVFRLAKSYRGRQ